jgi:hypothetical protein
MLFGKLLTNTPQVFADVRTYWSPDAVKRVTGHTLSGIAKDGFIHLLNSGSAAIDGAGEMTKDSTPAMKPFWEITPQEAKACLDATPGGLQMPLFQRRRILVQLYHKRRHACYPGENKPDKRIRTCLAACRRLYH